MSLRLPRSLSSATGSRPGFERLETEILAETAASLGYHGRAVEQALADLGNAEPEEREAHLQAAADAVWAYFIQREFCGFNDHGAIIREMGIPQAVLNRMGVMKRK